MTQPAPTLFPALQPQRARPATPAEIRFLRRYNWVRLARLLLFWFFALMVIGAIGLLHGLLVMSAEGSLWAALLVAVPLLVLDWVFLRKWGPPLLAALRVRPLLPVPADLQVSELRTQLSAIAHRTSFESNIFVVDGQLVDVPGHWEDRVATRLATHPARRMTIRVASLPRSRNEVIRLPINRIGRYPLKADLLLRDAGNILVGVDELSIEQEMQARLPMLRAHPGTWVIALLLAVAAGITGLFWDTQSDEHARLLQQAQQRQAELEARYFSGARVDIDALRARGFPALVAVEGTEGRVVRAASMDVLTVALSAQAPHHLLMPAELAPIQRATRVQPRTLPGRSPIADGQIDEFRAALQGAVGTQDAASARVQRILAELPDAMIGAQIRAQADRNSSDPAFVAALMPQPPLHPSERAQTRLMGCDPTILPCLISGNKPATWQQPAFVAPDGRVTLINATQIAQRDQLRRDQQAIRADSGHLSTLKFSTVLLLGIAAMLLVLHAAARLRYRRHQPSNRSPDNHA